MHAGSTCVPGEDTRCGAWIRRPVLLPHRLALLALCMWGCLLPHRLCCAWDTLGSPLSVSTGQRPSHCASFSLSFSSRGGGIGLPCSSTAAGARRRRSRASRAQARPWPPHRRPTPAAVAAVAASVFKASPRRQGGGGSPCLRSRLSPP